MSRQDKAITEKHARILRELVKRPENKVCGDCKRNDPRWASWNLGIFLCIRCSGIHRGMGTHISKIKSIDLDTWTPEQMNSIQRWGNKRANLYWEAHLKAGHVPPDHKMESFIRSKYESHRWALDGPPPDDPSILEDESAITTDQSVQHGPDTSTRSLPSNTSGDIQVKVTPTRQIQAQHKLLSTTVADQNTASSTTSHKSVPSHGSLQSHVPPDNDLFSLDFHAPASVGTPTEQSSPMKKDVKQDILSLFSAPPASASHTLSGPSPSHGVGPAQQSTWDISNTSQLNPPVNTTSMVGSNGIGQWGVSSGWDPQAAYTSTQANLWGSQPVVQQRSVLMNPSNVWASASQTAPVPNNDLFGAVSKKQDDVFGDLWGGFK